MALFRRTATAVPAYAEHLRHHGIDACTITRVDDFSVIPPISKEDYLHRYPVRELMWRGDVLGAEAWSTSSGSSGRPTYWPRGRHALEQSVDLHDRIFETFFQSRRRSTLVVVGFAMGNWIGGTYTYSAILELARRGHRVSVIAPGMDTTTILANIEELGPAYDQVVLAGYPPFVKDVIDVAGSRVLGQDLRLLLAGEAVSERWRDHVLDRLGRPGEPNRVCSIYGTADMGMIGHETPTTIAVRRAATSDGLLHEALFGDARDTPTFVEVDTSMRFIEVDEGGRFLFTADGAVPLVRYLISDEGRVWSSDQLGRVLRSTGHDIEIGQCSSSSCFVALHGRRDRAASLYAINIYPDAIRFAVEAHPHRLSGKFDVRVDETEEFEQRLVVEAELRQGMEPDVAFGDLLRDQILDGLLGTSDEYRTLHAVKGAAVHPAVVLREFGRTHGPKVRFR